MRYNRNPNGFEYTTDQNILKKYSPIQVIHDLIPVGRSAWNEYNKKHNIE